MSTTSSSRSSQQIRRCISRRIDLSKMGGIQAPHSSIANPSAASGPTRDSTKDCPFQSAGTRQRGNFCRQSSLPRNTTSHHSEKSSGTLTTYQLSGDEADELERVSTSFSTSPTFPYAPNVPNLNTSGLTASLVHDELGSTLTSRDMPCSQGLLHQRRNYFGVDHGHTSDHSLGPSAVTSSSRRVASSKPLLCPRSQPSPLSQSMAKDGYPEESKEDVALREKMYEDATWRMYYRITSSRQARQQSSIAAYRCRSIPLINGGQVKDDSTRWCERFIHNHTSGVVLASDKEVFLSKSLEGDIFDMDS
jgi:hypothetical protein